MKKSKYKSVFVSFLLLGTILLNACSPLRNHKKVSTADLNYKTPYHNASKKTMFVIAGNDGTEMFDMMAPFYLFSATKKANVFIFAENKSPIMVNNGLYVMPHFTFNEIDSLHIDADVLLSLVNQ